MGEVRIAAIVEGYGECEAVPILIRRIAQTIDPGFVPKVLPPLRVPGSRIMKEAKWSAPSTSLLESCKGREEFSWFSIATGIMAVQPLMGLPC